jgi:CheY-like chemotaxis protein
MLPAVETSPKRILVVDDLHDSALSLSLVLQHMGHTAEFVTDPWKALEAARRLNPELVFLDIGMPGIDGYALARMFRQEFGFEALRLVALTAWDGDKDRVESRRAGFDAHVAKPADPATLDSILKTVFDRGPARS